jgi:two-component system, chemotaxis family, protein-glutamate methylesterase/glutaminase
MNLNGTSPRDFPVVCLGGATVDIETYTEVIRGLPVDLGAAIVVINHLRAVGSRLIDSIVGCTKMPVEMIAERSQVQPNRIYVLNYGCDLHVVDGEFRLKPVSKPTGWTNVVTVFLDSLSKNWHGKLVVVILSGLDGDGAKALAEIKRVGGITIAQKIETTGDPSMPSNAIASGNIDLILSVEDIAKQIVGIAHTGKAEILR